MKPRVAVIRTGLANLASVLAGLRRAGADPYLTESADDVRNEQFVMLPGVGAFGAGMEMLRSTGIDKALKERFAANKPTMAICLGQQLLCRASEETPGVEGLGIVDAVVKKLPPTVRVPQLGWNEIQPEADCQLLKPIYTYFANSFCIQEKPAGWSVAYCEHGCQFVAAMEHGAWLTCQFHPELSGDGGGALLRRWIEAHAEQECAEC